MKKVFYLIILVSSLFCLSCKGKVEKKSLNVSPVVIEDNNLVFQVDPKSELLMMALRLAKVNAMSYTSGSDYVFTNDRLVEKYKDHPLIKQLSKATKKYNGNFSSELEIAKYISDDLTTLNVDSKNLPLELQAFWSRVNLNQFIDNLNDFAVKIQFERIWKMNEGKNRIGLTNLKEFYQKNDYKILSWVENTFFTKEYSCKFTINSSFYLRNYFFPLSARFSEKNVLLDLYHPMGLNIESFDDGWTSLYWGESIIQTILMENWEEIEGKIKPYVDEVLKKNKISVKKFNKENYIQEIRYYLSLILLTDYVKMAKTEEDIQGFQNYLKQKILLENVEEIILDHESSYLNNRDQYPEYKDFIIEYLKQFKI